MNKPLIIYGAGGLGREVKSMLPYVNQAFDLVGFLDDGVESASVVNELRVLGGVEWLEENETPVDIVVAIGNPVVKANVVKQLTKFSHVHFPTLIHERAHIQDKARTRIGEGSLICAGSIVTTSVTIGRHVLINLNTTIGHDSSIGNFASIMPGVNLAGNVEVGNEVMIGMGVNIINGIKVGDYSVIGAGSVVNHSIPSAVTVAGVPARVIK